VDFAAIYRDAEEIAGDVDTAPETRLLALCELLKESVPTYNWFGFYLAIPAKKQLVLGPFAGERTEHVRIDYGRGICGQAAETLKTFSVDDVTKESNYLACSLKVKAEIVVPVFHEGRFAGEIDIDSHTVNAFTPDDRAFLEKLAVLLAPAVAECPRN
jgi:L-methionine (R)-S-oxide reductase